MTASSTQLTMGAVCWLQGLDSHAPVSWAELLPRWSVVSNPKGQKQKLQVSLRYFPGKLGKRVKFCKKEKYGVEGLTDILEK